jgi:hypothetical protein
MMTMQNWVGILTVIVNILAILVNIYISNKTINANRKINEENAGKNRVIYETEQMDITKDNRILKEQLKTMLNSGNYTVLTAFVDLGNTTQTRFILGKIRP